MDVDSSAIAVTYRVFWTNAAGRIASMAEMVDAESDEAAVWEAQARSRGRAGEVWLGDRHVASLNGAKRIEG